MGIKNERCSTVHHLTRHVTSYPSNNILTQFKSNPVTTLRWMNDLEILERAAVMPATLIPIHRRLLSRLAKLRRPLDFTSRRLQCQFGYSSHIAPCNRFRPDHRRCHRRCVIIPNQYREQSPCHKMPGHFTSAPSEAHQYA